MNSPPRPRRRNRPSDRERQQRLRDRRKAEGWRRVSVWLSPKQVNRLETLGGDTWLGTTVKELLEQGATARPRPRQAARFDTPARYPITTRR